MSPWSTERSTITDMVALYYIELPKVNRDRRPLEELTPLELCLEYLKYAGEEESEYVKALVAQGGKELAMAQRELVSQMKKTGIRKTWVPVFSYDFLI